MRQGLIATLGAAAVCLLAPGAAFGLGFQNLGASPASTQAGANSNFSIHIEFSTASDDVKDIRIGLPPGQIGDPTVTPKCTVAQLNAASCPPNTQVGSVTTTINALGIPIPVGVSGALYNLVANPGEPARFGIVLTPLPPLPVGQIILQSAVELRQTDFGLDTVINDIPNTAAGLLPIDITAMDVTLFGTNPAFARNPTSCGQATTNFSADSYASPGTFVNGQASYTPTGCGSLPFSPTFSARVGSAGQTAPQSRPPVSTSIDQDKGEAGLRNATVLLPSNIAADLAVLTQVCSDAQFQAATCPGSSVVGSAIATSPLLTEPLAGPVILIANPGLPKLGLDLRGPLAMKLVGAFVATANRTGVAFNNLPDIPISHFALSFTGGPGGLSTTTTDLCQSASIFSTEFTAWSGATQSGDTAAAVDGCGATTARKITGSLRKAHSRKPKLKLKINGGSSDLRNVTVKLPKSLMLGPGKKGISVQSLALKHTKRKLEITTASASLDLRVGKGELIRTGHIGKRVKLKVKVLDAGGIATTRTVKIKAR